MNQHAATKVNLMTHESVTASYLQWCNILNIGYTYRDLYYDMSVIVYVHFAAAISPVQVYDCRPEFNIESTRRTRVNLMHYFGF